MPDRSRALAALVLLALGGTSLGADPIRDLQTWNVRTKDQAVARPYHFGSLGPNNRFSNSTGHSNRMVPVYTFGTKINLDSVAGKNSAYRDPARLAALYGAVPPNTLNPEAEYFDQSDLRRVQEEAVARGVKHLFIVWFDGMDWEATRAAAIVKAGEVYREGKGKGLIFQDFDAKGSARYGFCVTSPTHDRSTRDVDAQAVALDLANSLPGGYDPRFGGATPWGPMPLLAQAPGYLMGEYCPAADRETLRALGATLHAVTDSAPSAAEFASGVKSYNDGINVAPNGRFVETLFARLQRERGWKVGTATSVAFDHASPSAMYAHNVDRDDYQDLAREMLGLNSIVQADGRSPRLPGLDVVLGTGYGQFAPDATLRVQGKNAVTGQNTYLADADLKAVDARNGGPYVVATTTMDAKGADVLCAAAEAAARDQKRLFGFFGTTFGHLPFRTADGDYRPAVGIKATRESYSADDILENPTLADMTRAALTVLSADPARPFALFVEAGDVDFGLHDNNLDNAIGAIYSGEAAISAILEWVEAHSNWDDSAMIVTSDHGHYLVIDDPEALAAAGRAMKAAPVK